MMKSLEMAGYQEPSPIQAGLIPLALAGVDVVGQAQTGTGKTAAFAIPILEQLASRSEKPGPQALILTPTRELAVQVRDEVAKLAYGQKVTSVALYGGKPIRGQIDKLRQGAQVIIGTPGRVIDHMNRRTLDLKDLWCVVLDEADRMLDIGFRPDIERILRRCPKDRQTLLLSATVPPPIERLAERYMNKPKKLNISPKDITVETIDQSYFIVDHARKFELIIHLLKREKPRQAIIFCRTKKRTDLLYHRLAKRTKHVDCIHGDMQQSARDRVMKKFREGKLRLLVATDVVGRGIDVSNVSHIINYDVPQFCDDYVHRVGRTGRMGREGVAYSFIAPEEGNELTRIERHINLQLRRDEIEGFDATAFPTGPAGSPSAGSPPPPPGGGRGRRTYRRGL